ncbi:MAG TPA: hypothetical protein VH593_24740, partial [Ktedonobacteraceae bacterium]
RVQQQYRPLFATMRDRRLTKLFDPAQREVIQAQILDPVRGMIERGIQAGVFRGDLDRDLAAATVIGSFTGVFELLSESCSLDELEQRLSQLLWTMFTK